MLFDCIAARTPTEKTDQQSTSVLVGLWKALKHEQQLTLAPPPPTTSDAPSAPVEASPITVHLGWCLSHSGTGCWPRLPPGGGCWRQLEASC